MYESVPGTTVRNFVEKEDGVAFSVTGSEDAQITIGLEDDEAYDVFVNGEDYGAVKANMSGKVNISVELNGKDAVEVTIKKL